MVEFDISELTDEPMKTSSDPTWRDFAKGFALFLFVIWALFGTVVGMVLAVKAVF